MKIKTNDLINDALDWAVAKAENLVFAPVNGAGSIWFKFGIWTKPGPGGEQRPYVLLGEYKNWAQQCDGYVLRRGTSIWSPSTDWAQGGPIIDREKIAIHPSPMWKARFGLTVLAHHGGFRGHFQCTGPTPLVAAMRTYIRAKLGDEVEIPWELKQ